MKPSRILPPLALAALVLAAACGGGGDGATSLAGNDGNGDGNGDGEASPGERTRVAFVESGAGRLAVLDDGVIHPVHQLPEEGWPGSVDWSADGSQLLGADDANVFLWSGPDSEVVEVPCDGCDAVFVDDASGAQTVVAADRNGQVTLLAPDTLESTGTTVAPQLPAPDEPFTLWGDAGGRLVVTHYASSASTGPDMMSLLDPATGEQVAHHQGEGISSAGTVAIDAEGGRIAYFAEPADVPCGQEELFVLDGQDLTEIGRFAMPLADDGFPAIKDLFFNGDVLYATMTTYQIGGGGEYCEASGSAGLWRLAGGETWEQVDPRPVELARPVEGLTDEPHTGWVRISEGARASFEPVGASAGDAVDLSTNISGLWSMPTSTEVEAAGGSSGPTEPSREDDGGDGGGDEGDGSGSSGQDGGSAPDDTAGAISRYETFLHALGEGDIDTICEIAGPAAQVAEDQGFGSCEETFGMVFDMISPEQAEALRTATVDAGLVETRASGEVYIPAEAVVADVTFSESDLGSALLAHQDGNWYMIAG